MRLLLSMLIPLVLPLSVLPTLAQEEDLPPEIEQYYEDYSDDIPESNGIQDQQGCRR